MDHDRAAAIIANDLDSLIHRIEALPADERYTKALILVIDARNAVREGRTAVHQDAMARRSSGRSPAA
jgi:hypothetical protein